MVTIEVNRLRCYAYHGVGEQERTVGNEFEVSVSLVYPPAVKAVISDSIESTLDYAELIGLIRYVMERPSQLLEHVCGRLKEAIQQRFPEVSEGKIRVAKLTPPIAGFQMDEVAVSLVW